MNWKFAAIPILFFVVSLAVPVAHAEGEVALQDVPTYLAQQLGVSVFIGQLIAATILFMAILFPIFIATKNKTIQVMAGILVLSIGISLGWVPVWIFAVMVLGIAYGFGRWAQKFGG